MQWQAAQNGDFKRKAKLILGKIFKLKPNDVGLMIELFRCAKLSEWVVRTLTFEQFEILNREIESNEKSIGDSQLLLNCCYKFNPLDRLARVALVNRKRQNEILSILELEKEKCQVRIDICLEELWRCFNGYLNEESKLEESAKILKKLTFAEYEQFGSDLAIICEVQSWHLIGIIVKAFSYAPISHNQTLISHYIIRILQMNNKSPLESVFKAFWPISNRFNKVVDYLPFVNSKDKFIIILDALLQGGLSKELLDEELKTLICGIKILNSGRTKHIRVDISKEEITKIINSHKSLHSTRIELIKLLNESRQKS